MAMKTFNVGDVLAAADVNEYLVNVRFAQKGGDTSRVSTAAVANDADLQLAVDASKTYQLTMGLQFNAGTGGGFQFAFSGPAGAVMDGSSLSVTPAGSSNTTIGVAPYSQGADPFTSNHAVGGLGAGTTSPVQISAMFKTSATAGTLIFRWAQQTSNATATILMAGSWMVLRRVA